MIDGLDLVVRRQLLEDGAVTTVALRPGDRPLVVAGERVEPGTPIAERLRDPRVEEVGVDDPAVRPGARWSGQTAGSLRRRSHVADGELLAPSARAAGRWRVVTADHRQPLEAPVAGTVRAVRAGIGVEIAIDGRLLRGVLAAGTTARGRLELATDPGGEVRSGSLDVGRAGTVLAVGARIDAEALIRARAMGVRGVVVASLAGKDLRDLLASERRQHAGLHDLPPFAVLVLEGVRRRPIPAHTMAVLEALAGREVTILTDPPGIVVDGPLPELPEPPADRVHVRHGPHAGRDGTFLGLAGLRRFEAGVHLEAGWIRLDEAPPVALPLADLERLA